MVLIRMIVLKRLMENVRIFAKHVKGVKNGMADSLSRDNIPQFMELCAKANKTVEVEPTVVPECMWPMEKLWKIN